jgi:hypothetical protein
VALFAPPGVFDAFGWCASDTLEWEAPAGRPLDFATPVTSANPPGMVFVMRGDCDFLPKELARLHVPDVGRGDEWALAPWGIDDATDRLFEERVRPADALWLATGSLAGLFWGLHDWAHFHNHGPFDERAWTELQCDATALAWVWRNRDAIGIDAPAWERMRSEVEGVGARRFEEEGRHAYDARWLDASRVQAMTES